MKKLLSSKTILTHLQKYLLIPVVLLSISASTLASISGTSLAYNDAMSHLNISRFVIDNLQPGFAQLGGVWPPFTHILPLLFIWNDFMWHTGLAAIIFSMLSYIVCVWAIYKMLREATKSIYAAIVGGALFALNANILYLQATPLTEPLYLVLFTLSILCFVYWITKKNDMYILLLGILGFFQVVTRYDGWFVTFMEGGLIFAYDYFVRRNPFNVSFAKTVLFAFPVTFGIGTWLLWNTLIFKNPLFFAIGPYSAHAQQSYIQTNASLITKHNIPMSFLAYWYVLVDNAGIFAMILTGLGLLAFLLSKVFSLSTKILILLFLLAPIVFNILSLYLGFSVVNVPELHWNPSPTIAGEWFNVRYGIFILPIAAVMVGFLASFSKKLIVPILLVVLLQFFSMFPHNIITLTDGLVGSSSFYNKDIAAYLNNHVKPSDMVLLSVSYFNPVAFKSNIELRQIIHEGVEKDWGPALGDPEKYVNWIVMSNGNSGDPVYIALITKNKSYFLRSYVLAYRGIHANVYKLRNKNAQLVTTVH